MSTRELAHTIIDDLNEEQLKAFIDFFKAMSQGHNAADITEETESIKTERRAFLKRLEKYQRPLPELDEKKELEEYRREKYGV